jgi:hypothetical protein
VKEGDMFTRMLLALVGVVALVTLSGCYESPKVVIHKPGVYKGDRDPLLALERSAEQQKKLRDRFSLSQLDR